MSRVNILSEFYVEQFNFSVRLGKLFVRSCLERGFFLFIGCGLNIRLGVVFVAGYICRTVCLL